MNRLDRALGILLWLRSRKTVSAAELAKQFEVSQRTIYRDIETLSELGIPVYAEMGRAGGFRLLEGYFLPPVMFSVGEAVSAVIAWIAPNRPDWPESRKYPEGDSDTPNVSVNKIPIHFVKSSVLIMVHS